MNDNDSIRTKYKNAYEYYIYNLKGIFISERLYLQQSER